MSLTWWNVKTNSIVCGAFINSIESCFIFKQIAYLSESYRLMTIDKAYIPFVIYRGKIERFSPLAFLQINGNAKPKLKCVSIVALYPKFEFMCLEAI